MSTQIGQLELPAHLARQATIARLAAEHMAAEHMAAEHMAAGETAHPERPLSIARGIASAVLIAAPFWALFAFAIYMLI